MSKLNKFSIYALVVVLAMTFLGSTASAITWRERAQQLRQKYQVARSQYLKEVQWWRTSRQDFLKARSNYRRFKNSENKAAYEEQARKFLDRTVAVLIKRLETLKKWVSNRQSLPEEDRQAIIAEIDKDIAWLQDKQTKIASASLEELKGYAQDVRNYWRDNRWKVKKIVAHIWEARLDWVIGRFEDGISKAENKINELKAAGQDTSQLETWLADLKDKVNLAKEKKAAAEEKYQSINSLEEANALFNEARQFISQAHQYLKDARQDLVKIIKEMKQMNSSTANQQ